MQNELQKLVTDRLDVEGAYIVSVECCCNSCRAAGTRMQNLEGAPEILTEYGATPFVLYRKDRVRFVTGTDRLKEFRLSPDAGTRRVVASCCNTPVFLDFKGGHWLSLYAHLWPEGALPPLEMRTTTSELADKTLLPNDVPNLNRQSLSFFARLFGAWAAMRFRNLRIEVNGEINI